MGERSDANPALRFLSKISDDQMVVFFFVYDAEIGSMGRDGTNETNETNGTNGKFPIKRSAPIYPIKRSVTHQALALLFIPAPTHLN